MINEPRDAASAPSVHVVEVEQGVVAGAGSQGRDWGAVRQELVLEGDLVDELENLMARARKERKRLGLTQQAIAERMSVSQSRVSAIETGEVTAAEVGTVAKYLRALGIRPRLTFEFGK